jgi:hypothetical protein
MVGRIELQRRIDRLLHQAANDPPPLRSNYLDPAADVVEELWAVASAGDDVEAAVSDMLDRASALAVGPNLSRLRYALEIVVTNHPRLNQLGLNVPSLAERAPHLTMPSKRRPT